KGVSRPGFWEGRPSVWAGESLIIAELVTGHGSGTQSFVLQSLGQDQYQLLDAQGNALGQGRVGQKLVVESPWLELTVAELSAPASAAFTVIKKSRLAAINNLRERLDVVLQGKDTGILRLVLKGPDRQELVRSLNATTQVLLTQNI